MSGDSTETSEGGRRLEIRIDRDRCIGAGQCVHWAPTVFDQDKQAKAFVKDGYDAPEDVILKAVQSCPVEAITLEVGGVTIAQRDLSNWMLGASTEDPVVTQLARLADGHHELQVAIGAASEGGADPSELVSTLTAAHLDEEQAVYADLRDLIGPDLVDAFLDGHARIDAALTGFQDHASNEELRAEKLDEFAAALGEQVRLEESVLFPVALASIVRRSSE